MHTIQRNEKIEEYGHGFDALAEALEKIPVEAWKFRPSEKEWSIHEIIVHMGDSESMAAIRVRKLIVEPGSRLMAYEEGKWAKELDYESQSTEDSLAIIKYARQTTYNILKSLPEEIFAHSVMHAEYPEPYTFERWLNIYSRHIPEHIEQMQSNYKIWKETVG